MKKTYHHGNLKEVLLDKAQILLIEKGVKGLSIRAVAKMAEVSEAAPYSHFKNKNELLEALALAGYRKLSDSLHQATKLNDFTRMERLAIGYVNFALENVELFRLMFGLALSEFEFSEHYKQVSQQSYRPMQAEVARLLERSSSSLTEDEAVAAAWSIVHGLSMLIIDKKLALPKRKKDRWQFIAKRCSVIESALT